MTSFGFLLSFLLLYKYFALFVLIFIGASLLPIPINFLLLAAGAFASQGYFNFSISLMVAVIANIAGDSFDYYLAQKYGNSILKKLHIQIPNYIEKLEHYVKQHAGVTVFLTRFFGITGILTNFLSGFIGIPFIKFVFYDFLGNFISTTTILSIGYFLGLDWENFSNASNFPNYIIAAIIITTIIGMSFWHKKYQRKKSNSSI